ncbi:MAG: hypothetical protein HY681_04095 [Chloroflexi bacterium]|nr:hypothetical protein [Chloroflexota bacterium]
MTFTQTEAAPAPAAGVAAQDASRPSPSDVIRRLREAITSGMPWQQALLEAVGRWPLAVEERDGVRYQYLLLGEAFDWLMLAGRLLEEVECLVPDEGKEALLFTGKLPSEITDQQFQQAIGPDKYRAHLNYFYGVMVEEALLLEVEEEVRKDRTAHGLPESRDITGLAHERIYGAPQEELLADFWCETVRPASRKLSVLELKEFTYWLFKRRVACTDSAKVASDTKKGLEMLARMTGAH